ncbi:MAG: class I SAM-dependent methyltransferase [Halobacteriaceae archaeon]
MSVQEEFDRWARKGRDRGMEERHWHTAKHALARMPVDSNEAVLDLGTGSGYALRALREAKDIRAGIGIDGSTEMLRNAMSYTDDDQICYLAGDFQSLPIMNDCIDHVWSMEALYYAGDPVEALAEVRRVLKPGGTFFCCVNYFEESQQTHHWQESIDVEMTLWDREQYRQAFDDVGFHLAEQDAIPDREIEIPPADAFPIDGWDSREDMVDRYRTWGTLLTVGVHP